MEENKILTYKETSKRKSNLYNKLISEVSNYQYNDFTPVKNKSEVVDFHDQTIKSIRNCTNAARTMDDLVKQTLIKNSCNIQTRSKESCEKSCNNLLSYLAELNDFNVLYPDCVIFALLKETLNSFDAIWNILMNYIKFKTTLTKMYGEKFSQLKNLLTSEDKVKKIISDLNSIKKMSSDEEQLNTFLLSILIVQNALSEIANKNKEKIENNIAEITEKLYNNLEKTIEEDKKILEKQELTVKKDEDKSQISKESIYNEIKIKYKDYLNENKCDLNKYNNLDKLYIWILAPFYILGLSWDNTRCEIKDYIDTQLGYNSVLENTFSTKKEFFENVIIKLLNKELNDLNLNKYIEYNNKEKALDDLVVKLYSLETQKESYKTLMKTIKSHPKFHEWYGYTEKQDIISLFKRGSVKLFYTSGDISNKTLFNTIVS